MTAITQGALALGSASPSVFNFNSHRVRIIMRGGEPWFVATDVCVALGYANTSKAVADHLDVDERSHEQLDRSRMGSKAVIINESGLYALVLRSRKPEARKFAKWVTGEVLPSIRKTGGYQDSARMQLAYSMAAQAAATVSRAVFEAVVAGDDRTQPDRWLVHLGYESGGKAVKPLVSRVEADAVVTTFARMTAALRDPGGMYPTTQELRDMADACLERLARRAEYAATKQVAR